MSSIYRGATLPGSFGWILALDFDNETPKLRADADQPLAAGRYVAVLNTVDCEGCAAAVEDALQAIRGVSLAGVSPQSSTLVFEVIGASSVYMSDILEELSAVSKAMRKMVSIASFRGPYSVMCSAAA